VDGPTPNAKKSSSLRRLWPVALILVGIALFFTFDLDRYFDLALLRQYHQEWRDFVAANFLLASLFFILAYVLVVALSLPGGVILTLMGGYLFGALLATTYVVVAATIGASLLFLATRTSLAAMLQARAGPWLVRLQAGFQRDAWSYLLMLRLVPLFPFFVVNLVPAFLGVSLRCFAVTTFFGIIPGTFVYALVGSGLGDVLQSGAYFALDSVLSPKVLTGLFGLALLAALPIVVRHMASGRNRKND
jgi:uncharacterized membrane protein YdjX (TVP38/TMEM64 family)